MNILGIDCQTARNVSDVSKKIRARNRDNGFYLSRLMQKLLAMSELFEMLEAIRNNHITTPMFVINEFDQKIFLDHVKDTREDEAADVIIRLLDACGSSDEDHFIGNADEGVTDNGTPLSEWFYTMVKMIMDDEPVLDIIKYISHEFSFDLEKHIDHKLKFNATRPQKHGKVF
jgi:NTP pyrophosphatase (non-canonical NTP hydrolase)